jgi:hypothetical protein
MAHNRSHPSPNLHGNSCRHPRCRTIDNSARQRLQRLNMRRRPQRRPRLPQHHRSLRFLPRQRRRRHRSSSTQISISRKSSRVLRIRTTRLRLRTILEPLFLAQRLGSKRKLATSILLRARSRAIFLPGSREGNAHLVLLSCVIWGELEYLAGSSGSVYARVDEAGVSEVEFRVLLWHEYHR